MSTQTTLLQGSISENAVILTDKNIGHWFSIIKEDTLSFQSQITDNYIENNTSIQDHIALNPEVITLRGYIGEVEFRPPVTFTNYLVNGKYDIYNNNDEYNSFITEKLSPLTALLPPVDNVTQMAKNTVQYVESSFNRYKRIYNQIIELSKNKQKQVTESVQQYAAKNLRNMWKNRTLVEVVSPFGFYQDMAIQSVTLTQGDTTMQSELSVTLKQLNYAETNTTEPDTATLAWYNAIARTDEANHGKAQGVEEERSTIFYKLLF